MTDVGEAVLNAEVVRRVDFTDELFVLGVKLRDKPLAPFEAGQYATLGLPREVAGDSPGEGGARPGALLKRPYSIASGGNELECYEFLVTTVPDGQLTPRLHRLNSGDGIWMDGRIRGTFRAAQDCADTDVVMIATGTGLAPFRSMLRSYPLGQRWRRLALIHGVRQVKDAVYGDELGDLARTHAAMRYIPAVSRETPTGLAGAVAGRVQAALDPSEAPARLGFPLDPTCVRVLLCGSPAMIADIKTLLAPLGFGTGRRDAPGGIFSEKYW